MGKNRSRSRSRSQKKSRHQRDRSRERQRSPRDNRERERDRDRDRNRRSRSTDRRERKSNFDVDGGGQKVQRKSKWSDLPPDPSQNIYDPNAARLAAQSLIQTITINPEAQKEQSELRDKQAEIFNGMLSRAKFEGQDSHIETIRPTAQKGMGGGGKFNNNFGNMGGDMMQMESTKIKRKIYIPKNANFNYTGLIIGPKGANQKRLEEETGCKILVRGRGSQKEGAPPQPDDDEDLHVLLVGDNERQIASATAQIERIIFADEETRVKIRQEQLKLVAQIKDGISRSEGKDLSMTTPYGPPSEDAYVIQVPNDCVGLVIGKGGETIRQLQMQSGAKKVQVAADSQKEAASRNIFVEGDRQAYEIVKNMIDDIVQQQKRLRQAMTGVLPDNSQGIREEVPVPDNLVGLVIGRGGETVKSINQRTGAVVFIPKECEPGKNERIFLISGTPEQVQQAKEEVLAKVNEGLRNLQMKALQASGIPIQWMANMGYGDPHFLQQYMSSFDPQYAAMYQQMYAQQPVVTTVTDSSSLPGSQPTYQQGATGQQYQMPNYQFPQGAVGGVNPYQVQGQQDQGGNVPNMGNGFDMQQQYMNYGAYGGNQFPPQQNNTELNKKEQSSKTTQISDNIVPD